MLDFKAAQISDREWVVSLLREEGIPLCDYSFVSFYCWQHVFHHQICRFGDRLLVHAQTAMGSAYLWPAGKGDPMPALLALEEHAASLGEPLRLVAALEEHLAVLKELFPDRVEIKDLRDNYDYHYDINRLADLPGRKLHAKRNHINRFRDGCPFWSFAPILEEDVPDCMELNHRWYHERVMTITDEEERASLAEERKALDLALNNLEELSLDGGLIRCGNELLAFSLGSLLTETLYDIHFEKARTEYQGAFSVINQEFARYIRECYPKVTMIDREEDMGQLGLRRSKMSYGPDRLVENYCALIRPSAAK